MRHRIIVIDKDAGEKANSICADLHGKAADQTFTIALMDSNEKESKFWACWLLSDKELTDLLKGFDGAGITADVYDRDKNEPAELLGKLKLHLKETEEELHGTN